MCAQAGFGEYGRADVVMVLLPRPAVAMVLGCSLLATCACSAVGPDDLPSVRGGVGAGYQLGMQFAGTIRRARAGARGVPPRPPRASICWCCVDGA
ncbi:hypothetical protein [Nocardia miyunensis]|uniref:hypothetical protein n=1 Tax=Nocardia miyunensis TaxID=282684 RepID=UPI00082B9C37|nr:hypothetical protein [Nocardia miyunensis]